MTIKINGWNRDGWAQTGKGEVITLWVAHPIAATGVIATRVQLLADGLVTSATLAADNSYTVNGVTYTADAAYDEALWQQANLDDVLAQMGLLANSAYVRVWAGVATVASPTVDFAGVFVAGVAGHTFGTNLTEANSLVYRLDVMFEQKGMFTTGTKGDVTIATGDHMGDSVTAVEALFDGMLMTATVASNALDVDINGGAVAAGVQYAIDTTSATVKSIIAEVSVAPELQS